MIFIKSDIVYLVNTNKMGFLCFSIILETVYTNKSLKFSFVKVIIFRIF